MACEAENASEVLFACPTCGRRVVVGKGEPKFVVLDRGDFYARHTGSLGGVEMAPVVV